MIRIIKTYGIFLIGALLTTGCIDSQRSSNEKDIVIEHKVDSLLNLMTIEEKIGQMSQVRHFGDIQAGDVARKFIGSVIHTEGPTPGQSADEWQARFRELQEEAMSTRLAIPLLLGVDAIHGQNTFDGATIFPHNIGMAATHDKVLMKNAARITATEVRATGLNWTFAPCVAIPYNEKWGRVYEGLSEDTDLTSELTVASIEGLQGTLDSTSVLATAKHYIADGATDFGIEGGESSLSRQEIFSRLFPPYKEAVRSGVGAIMVGFNTLGGVPMHAYKALITDSLKQAYGFKGMVITDWKGYSRFGGNDIINAGVDMVMAVDGDLDPFQQGVKQAVENGDIPIARINDAVRRILRQKFRMGLFEHPFPDSTLIDSIGTKQHRAVARQAVRESLVLLKNEEQSLPIQAGIKKIVVVGEHANNAGFQSGGWTIHWQGMSGNYQGATTILAGIKQTADANVVYDSLGDKEVYDADVAIIVVGETPYAEFFGDIRDSTSNYSLTLTSRHQDYINKYAGRVQKTIVVLISGRPLVVTKQIEQSDAFVVAWLPGSEGDGIAEVLFGNYNFTGKLPHSWPASEADFAGKYGPNFWDKTAKPLFGLGFGMSYN